MDDVLERFFKEWEQRLQGEYGLPIKAKNVEIGTNKELVLMLHEFFRLEYQHLPNSVLDKVENTLKKAELRFVSLADIKMSGGSKRIEIFKETYNPILGNKNPDLDIPQGVLKETSSKKYVIVDGNHRFMKLMQLEVKEAWFIVFEKENL